VRPAQEHQAQPALQFPPHRVRHLDRRDRRVGIVEHLDIVDPPERRAQLILHAGLLPEDLRLDAVGGVGHLERGQARGGEAVERADQRHGHRGRSARRAAGRRLREDRDVHAEILGHAHIVDGRLEQGVVDPLVARRRGKDGVALAKVLRVEDAALRLGVPRVDGDLHLDVRVDADVEDAAVPGEPGIRPAAVVAHADGRHAVDDAVRSGGGRRHGHLQSAAGHAGILGAPREAVKAASRRVGEGGSARGHSAGKALGAGGGPRRAVLRQRPQRVVGRMNDAELR